MFFLQISKGKVTNLKIPGDFFRKVYPQPPLPSLLTKQAIIGTNYAILAKRVKVIK